jgi:hypothetical protein
MVCFAIGFEYCLGIAVKRPEELLISVAAVLHFFRNYEFVLDKITLNTHRDPTLPPMALYNK